MTDWRFEDLSSQQSVARLALQYTKILTDILSFRKSKQHRPVGLASLSDLKRGVIELLSVCSEQQIPPPRELTVLVGKLFESASDERRRIKGGVKNRGLLKRAAEMHLKTGLTGRALARALRAGGIDAPDRTIATYCATEEFKEKVELLRGDVPQ
jgi:hypothetical protein